MLLVIDLLACWWSSGRPRNAVIWKMTSICLFWCSWRERKNRSFEDLESSLEEILSSFYFTLYFWVTAYVHLYLLHLLTFSLAFLFLIRCFLCMLLVY